MDLSEAVGPEDIDELAELADVGEGLRMPRSHQGLAAFGLEKVDLLRFNGNAPPVLQVQQDAVFEDGHESSLRLPVVSDIAPAHQRLPDRIRAHTFICFLALVIQRTLRHRLHRSPLGLSPEELLYRLRSIQRHSVRLATGKNLEGLSAITPEQRSMFDAAGVPLPTMKRLETAM